MRLGDYELDEVLAKGGMGVVYRARHVELGRSAAVKVVRRERAAEPGVRARFLREAQALARLRHKNVVPVHTVEEADGQLFLVMSLVEGTSLQERLNREGPLAPGEAVRIVQDLARALDHAHEQGILHRDVKPDNVLLTDEEPPRPLLTDFGLARDLSEERERLTLTGQLVGTPAFMPPEQAASQAERVDRRSDVYGLGATLYALLTGRPPIEGANLIHQVAAIVSQAPVPPRQLAPAVDPALEAVVLRCLAKRPEDRYPTAAALADDLVRWRAGTLPGPRRFYPRLVIGALALACLVALGALIAERPPAPGPAPLAAETARASSPTVEDPGGLEPLRWRLARGQTWRCSLQGDSVRSLTTAAQEQLREGYELGQSARFVLRVRVRKLRGARAQLEATIESGAIHSRAPDGAATWRSGEPGAPTSPFVQLLGGRFRLWLDTRSGAVDQVGGVQELQQRVLDASQEVEKDPLHLDVLTDDGMQALWSMALHYLPPDPLAPTWKQDARPRYIDGMLGKLQSRLRMFGGGFDDGLDFAIHRDFQREGRGGVRWRGRGGVWQHRGRARFADGRALSTRATSTLVAVASTEIGGTMTARAHMVCTYRILDR